jgi:hypothetical protein
VIDAAQPHRARHALGSIGNAYGLDIDNTLAAGLGERNRLRGQQCDF